jgi:hypothetical protein
MHLHAKPAHYINTNPLYTHTKYQPIITYIYPVSYKLKGGPGNEATVKPRLEKAKMNLGVMLEAPIGWCSNRLQWIMEDLCGWAFGGMKTCAVCIVTLHSSMLCNPMQLHVNFNHAITAVKMASNARKHKKQRERKQL